MSTEACNIRHNTIETQLRNHDSSLQTQKSDIEKLKIDNVKIYEQMKSLVMILKWLVTVLSGVLISTTVYAIQKFLF